MPLPQRDMHKYLVFKWTDIASNLNSDQIDNLNDIIRTVVNSPNYNNRNYVVVSDKNPELYEEVWGMKLAEIANDQRSTRDRLIAQIYGIGAMARTSPHVVHEDDTSESEYFVDEGDTEESEYDHPDTVASSYTMNISEDQITLSDYSGNHRVTLGSFNGDSSFTDTIYGHAANSN